MSELRFGSNTRLRKWRFISDSFRHPAKLVLPLQIWLIERYSKPGDILLDCMAGSGTILVGAAMGRHIICVELEEKFCEIMRGNWEKIQQQGPELGYSMGNALILQGDARNLSEIVGEVDLAVFSPPYSESLKHPVADREAEFEKLRALGYKINPDSADNKVMADKYSDNPANIGNLKHGNLADVIMSSPPYEGSVSGKASGIDWSKGKRENGRLRDRSKEPAFGHLAGYGMPLEYSDQLSNIGNLKGQTYLEAMKLVYAQCFAILKPNGWLVLVVKNFIRDHKEIDLAGDTVQLCENAGFHLEETHYRRLTSQSFWRTIALQRCDHRRGSKQELRCKLGLTCPVKEEQQLSMEQKPKSQAEVVEKLCSSFVNSSPAINREWVLAFRKEA